MLVLNFFMYSLLVYLGLAVIYQLTYSIAGKFSMRRLPKLDNRLRKFAVFIPAYKEDAVILNVAKSALQQDYPTDLFDVIVIADSMKRTTIEALEKLPIRLFEVSFEKSTKSKALNRAMAQLEEDYEVALILDADNIMTKNFLHRMNEFFQRGYQAVQGRRVAKNMDTRMAILDGASEEINNHILCKGHNVLGFSARLAGSGMAFDYGLFEEVMKTVDAVGGFDKELELKMTQRGISIVYDDKAFVYDEKVSENEVFVRQRSRWIAAQFHYCRKFFGKAVNDFVKKGNIDFFNKALQTALPPRLVLPGVLGIVTLAYLIVGNFVLAAVWGAFLIGNLASFLIAIPLYFFKRKYRYAFLTLPLAFASAVLALLRIGKANKRFIHTPHTTTSVDFKPTEILE